MNGRQILVVDDERALVREIEGVLSEEGYEVMTASDGESGLAVAAAKNPDVVILDVLMPGLDGLEVCRRLRRRNPDVRIIFLSAMSQEMDKVRGLEGGADDYLTKPFSVPELKARIRTLLRRTGLFRSGAAYSFGDVIIDTVRREVTRAGRVVDITSKEFDLLTYFVQHQGEALSRDRILEDVWGNEEFPTTRTVDVHIMRLRKKLEPDPSQPRFFLTLHGKGYRFDAGG